MEQGLQVMISIPLKACKWRNPCLVIPKDGGKFLGQIDWGTLLLLLGKTFLIRKTSSRAA